MIPFVSDSDRVFGVGDYLLVPALRVLSFPDYTPVVLSVGSPRLTPRAAAILTAVSNVHDLSA